MQNGLKMSNAGAKADRELASRFENHIEERTIGRRDMLVGALRKLGLECDTPRATFYLWTRVPKGYTSVSFTERVLKEAGVAITPGFGFGKGGEGYVRFSLTVSSERLREAVDRLTALRF